MWFTRWAAVVAVGVGALMVGAGGAGGAGGGGGAGGTAVEVSTSPAALVAIGVQRDDLMVYGVRLGDGVEKIPSRAGVARQVSERPRDAVYAGPTVKYFAHDGAIYQIEVLGDIVRDMPPYDAVRLQMRLGQADEILSPAAEETRLVYFKTGLEFSFHGTGRVTAVDVYAP